MSRTKGFFVLVFVRKKCEGHLVLERESAPARQLIHAELSSNGSGVSESHDEDAVWYDEEREQAWCRRSYWHLLTTDHSQWEPPWER